MRRQTILAVVFSVVLTILPGFRNSTALAAPSSARQALELTLPEVNFDNISISSAIDFLRDVSGANIHPNWKALEEAGIGKDTNVNVRLRAVSLRKVLNLILNEAGHGSNLAFYIDQNVIEITTRELADKDMITKVYPVQDLLLDVPDFDQDAPQFQLQATRTGRGGGGGGGQLFSSVSQQTNAGQNTKASLGQQLVDIIQTTIQPEVWIKNGGAASAQFFNGSLIVTAPRSVHEALGGPVE
jgi:hypothetical protein